MEWFWTIKGAQKEQKCGVGATPIKGSATRQRLRRSGRIAQGRVLSAA